MSQATTKTPFTPYQKKLFFFLGVATFFEGYDFMALSQLLPTLQKQWDLSDFSVSILMAIVNAGTVLAYFLIRQMDRWGRKPLLTITILGYTYFSILSGLASTVYFFTAFQFLARVFLIGEWAISMVYVAEEFPADRRGEVLGYVQGFSSLGAIVCAGLVEPMLKTEWGWRTVYFVGAVPLILMAIARRSLKETSRFVEQGSQKPSPLFRIWSSPYRNRMLQLALIWGVTYICTHNATTFWKQHVASAYPDHIAKSGLYITIAAVVSMPLVFLAGKLIDSVGRRMGAAVIYVLTSIGVVLAFQTSAPALLVIGLALCIFGSSAFLPVLNAYNTELFPTDLRGDAFAWANNLLGRLSYVVSPLAIGYAADPQGLGTGWGLAMTATAICPIIALFLVWALMPETKGKELEETSQITH